MGEGVCHGPRGRVADMSEEEGFKSRVTRQSEEAIGKLAQELLENPVVSGALSRAFETRERAMRAQEVAMGALNLPSASDLERLTRRVRSVSQRLEGIEDGLDRIDDRVQRGSDTHTLEDRLARIEAALERLEATKTAATAKDGAAKKSG
jgi:predicted  nucleic acid-binding Zn-ribbon protein